MFSKEVEKILPDVQKPARYTGGELNSVVKDKNNIDLRFAFCFPDTYEVGMSHLGLKILYGAINERDNYWCERVFAPWIDMEEKMRENNIPLYGLESGDALSEFDMIGFTLQYEMSYTNVLNMLDLSNIPLLSKDRTGLKNIVVGGGPCSCNPEPLADFFDVFSLGDGEEALVDLMDLLYECKTKGDSREQFLRKASHLEGFYVPSLYDISYNEDGTLSAISPVGDAPKMVRKRSIENMDTAYFPDKFVVPYVQIIHDRAVSEVLRGCIRGCRFCQAGFIYRPYREKNIETINKQCKAICDSTGYDEISLSSLSTSDYSELFDLIDNLHMWTEEEKVSVSLPSLRVDNFSQELTDKIKSIRKSGLTFAPEAGSQRMRDVINKNVTEEQLMRTVEIAFKNGWTRVKLYFMIGLPTETIEDVLDIVRLGQAVVNKFYNTPERAKGQGVSVTASASSFVPKPFTPFQWFGQDTAEVLREKQKALKTAIPTKKLSVNYHESKTSFLEAVFARGDRKLAQVLLEGHKRGFKFDGWKECFDFDAWMQVFTDLGIDPAWYANRQRCFEEILPWDHLSYGVTKEFLINECKKAYAGQITPNCKEKCSNCGAACFKGGVCYEKSKNLV